MLSTLRNLMRRLRRPAPPVITSEHGVTTEWCRKQAALNMRADHAKRDAVERLLAEQLGSEDAGVRASMRQFPEAYLS
jgi:hypothetical protein